MSWSASRRRPGPDRDVHAFHDVPRGRRSDHRQAPAPGVRPQQPATAENEFGRRPLRRLNRERCSRSASCRPARPSTTSTRREARVDAVESIGDGLEDYYAGGAEARGAWIGTARARARPHRRRSTARRCGACSPAWIRADGSPLRSSSSPVKVAGFDLTFSAPKSVSVLFGDRRRRRCAPRSAARTTARCCEARRLPRALGGGGRVAATAAPSVEPATGLVAAAFRHRTSRAGDPQLHTHVLVANLGRGPDGRWSALDGRRLYAHARAASFLYQAVLRARAHARARRRVDAGPQRDRRARRRPAAGAARRSAGGARRSRRRSTRARDVGPAGGRGGGARRPGDARTARHGRRARSRVARAGGRARLATASELERLARPRRDAGARRARRGSAIVRRARRADRAHAAARRRSRAATSFQALVRAAAGRRAGRRARARGGRRPLPGLAARRRAGRWTRGEGRGLPAPRRAAAAGRARASSSTRPPELLALEQRLIRQVARARRARGAGRRRRAGRRARDRGAADAVGRAARDGRAALPATATASASSSARPGPARRSRSPPRARRGRPAGHPVLGVAVARRAARELERRRRDPEHERRRAAQRLASDRRCRARCVLVVDEAGMVPDPPAGRALDRVEAVERQARARRRSPPAARARGRRRVPRRSSTAASPIELTREPPPGPAAGSATRSTSSATAAPSEALARYRAHGRIHVGERHRSDARERLVADWWAAGDRDGAVMIAHRRADVADLNARARELMRAAGALGIDELALPGGAVRGRRSRRARQAQRPPARRRQRRPRPASSPSIRTRRRSTLDLGGRAVTARRRVLSRTATAHGDPTLAARLRDDRARRAGPDGRPRLRARRGRHQSRVGYIALSRGRETNHLYLAERLDDARDEFAPAAPVRRGARERLIASLESSRAQVLAIDTGIRAARELRRDDGHELGNRSQLRSRRENRLARAGSRARTS